MCIKHRKIVKPIDPLIFFFRPFDEVLIAVRSISSCIAKKIKFLKIAKEGEKETERIVSAKLFDAKWCL
jgi:hypothetical protein